MVTTCGNSGRKTSEESPRYLPRNWTNHGGGDFDTKNGCKVPLKMGFNQGKHGISMDFLHSGGWNQSNRGFSFECAKTG